MKTNTPFLSLLAIALLLTSVAGRSASMSFAGTFKSNELSISLRANDSGYAGTIQFGDQTFPLTAIERNGQLEGWFRGKDGQFAFTGTMDGDTLGFTTDGTTYKLTRVGSVNPLAKKQATPSEAANPLSETNLAGTLRIPATRTNEPAGGPASGAAWKTFRHPTGLSMAYPPDWQLKEHPQMLQLIPPDAASNADGPTEAYLVLAEAAEDAQSAEDPRVIQFLDGQLAQLIPALKRTSEPEKVRAGAAPGILATWEGNNSRGMLIRAQAFATILKGYGVALIALGDKNQISRREKTLRGVFASFAAGEGQKDPQLVGTWKYWHYSTSALGGYSTERTRFLALRPDGTCLWSSHAESGGSVQGRDSLGNETYRAGHIGVGETNDRGTWSAGSGKLYVMWQNGSLSEWGYTVSGQSGSRRLLLKNSNQQTADEWMEQRQ